MKFSLSILLFLFISLSYSQYKKGTVFFKDSTKSIGYIKFKNFSGIKFKNENESKAISYDHNDIIGFDISKDKYRYEYVENKSKPKLLRIKVKGRISLFVDEFNDSHTGYLNGNQIKFGRGEVTINYIKKNNKTFKIGRKLKSKYYYLFEDSPKFYKDLKKGKYKTLTPKPIINGI